MNQRSVLLVSGLLILAIAMAACGDATTPTAPTTSPVTETFSGQFIPGGGASRAFTAASSGTVSLTLTSITLATGATAGFGIGIPQANNAGCLLNQVVQAAGSATPQITATVEAGTYCVRVYDTGALTVPVAFSITIVRP